MKIAISFLKIGSEFQGIFSVALGLVEDVIKDKNNQISIIIDNSSFKNNLKSRFPDVEIIYLKNDRGQIIKKISIFIYLFLGLEFLKKIFCKSFIEIENRNFDIIIHPNWSIYSFGLKTFSIASVHDTAFNNKDYKQSTLHKIKLKYLIKLICKYSNIILCESETGKKDIINIFKTDPNKILIRLNLPDVQFKKISNKPKQVFSEKFKKLKNERFLLLPSRWGQYKNQPRVIKSLEKFNLEKKDSLKLVLIGVENDIEKIDLFMNQNKLSKENLIIYPSVEINELIELYQNAYALVFPVLLGPTSIPFYEALENNCPIITSNLEGHKEVLGDAAIFVDPFSEESIYKSFIELNDKTILSLKQKMLKQKKYLENMQHEKNWLNNSLNIFQNLISH
mgnify:CR=1 FL=1